jgi:hypothetical protein
LLGDTQHRSDFRPRTIGFASVANRVQQCRVDVVSLLTRARPSVRNAAIATERASFGSFFCALPEPRSRVRVDSTAETR